jgi:uncharacterized protein (DUF1015 family)
MKRVGVLEKETTDCLYLYQITDIRSGYSYSGITGLASVDDYLAGRIKVHEHTLSKKEEALVQHIDYVKSIGEPVLLTFHGGEWYNRLIKKIQQVNPLYQFTGDELVKTELWPIKDEKDILEIQSELRALEAFYIADGHHRSAGAARYCQAQREKYADFKGDEPFNYFLAYFIPMDKLRVFEFNRLVKDLGGLSETDLLLALEKHFTVQEIGHATLRVKKKNYLFGMYMGHNWYGLNLREPIEGNVLDRLDVSVLENKVLKGILGIRDSKSDERLSFLDGTKGISRLQELVDIGEYKVAFSLFPTRIEEVVEVADNQLVMPPKSTWFEPKLRTGLLIYELE